jgi:hypothetical protein
MSVGLMAIGIATATGASTGLRDAVDPRLGGR